MTATHTPGPWIAHCAPSGAWIEDVNMAVIARWDGESAGRMAMPNARLIAAAPDLLAALWDVIHAAEGGINGRNVTADTRRAECAVIARAAIARAKATP